MIEANGAQKDEILNERLMGKGRGGKTRRGTGSKALIKAEMEKSQMLQPETKPV